MSARAQGEIERMRLAWNEFDRRAARRARLAARRARAASSFPCNCNAVKVKLTMVLMLLGYSLDFSPPRRVFPICIKPSAYQYLTHDDQPRYERYKQMPNIPHLDTEVYRSYFSDTQSVCADRMKFIPSLTSSLPWKRLPYKTYKKIFRRPVVQSTSYTFPNILSLDGRSHYLYFPTPQDYTLRTKRMFGDTTTIQVYDTNLCNLGPWGQRIYYEVPEDYVMLGIPVKYSDIHLNVVHEDLHDNKTVTIISGSSNLEVVSEIDLLEELKSFLFSEPRREPNSYIRIYFRTPVVVFRSVMSPEEVYTALIAEFQNEEYREMLRLEIDLEPEVPPPSPYQVWREEHKEQLKQVGFDLISETLSWKEYLMEVVHFFMISEVIKFQITEALFQHDAEGWYYIFLFSSIALRFLLPQIYLWFSVFLSFLFFGSKFINFFQESQARPISEIRVWVILDFLFVPLLTIFLHSCFTGRTMFSTWKYT